jgi:hypothetical protein
MSKPICFLFAAVSLGFAPRLLAQAPGKQTQPAVTPAILAHSAEVIPKSKGRVFPKPSASQRAPDKSKLVVVTTASGERRLARPKKRD